MPLNIKNPEADRLARALAERTGESITDAVTQALRGRLRREEDRAAEPDLAEELMEIGRRCAALPYSTIAARTKSSATTNMAFPASLS